MPTLCGINCLLDMCYGVAVRSIYGAVNSTNICYSSLTCYGGIMYRCRNQTVWIRTLVVRKLLFFTRRLNAVWAICFFFVVVCFVSCYSLVLILRKSRLLEKNIGHKTILNGKTILFQWLNENLFPFVILIFCKLYVPRKYRKVLSDFITTHNMALNQNQVCMHLI